MDRDLPARTSAIKLKSIPTADLERLTTYLSRLARAELAPVVADWLIAGCATGLRPSEWRCSSLNGTTLTVRNGKFNASMNRANGEFRHLDLSTLADRQVLAVRRMAERGAAWERDREYDAQQSRCAAVLYAATTRCWPDGRRAYSLYSARHQAAANLKASGSRTETAAVLGHATTRAAQQSYGKARRAWSGGERQVARADPAEVATVRIARLAPWERVAVPVEEIVTGSSPTF